MPPMKRAATEVEPLMAGTWSPAAVARHWGVPLSTVRELLCTGKLDFCQIAGKVRVPQSAVEAYPHQPPQRPAARKVHRRRQA
jgi:excisionase family DNA binding protein